MFIRVAIIAVIFYFLLIPSTSGEPKGNPYTDIKKILSNHYPVVQAISKDGEKLLIKHTNAESTLLDIVDLGTKRNVSVANSVYGFYTTRWSKDGNFVYYFTFSLQSHDYQLHLYSVKNSLTTAIRTISMPLPRADLSFDNRFFGVISETGYLVVLQLEADGTTKEIFKSEKLISYSHGFSWAHFSNKIAYVHKEKPSEILLFDLNTGKHEKIVQPNEVMLFSWDVTRDQLLSLIEQDGKIGLYQNQKFINQLNLPAYQFDISSFIGTIANDKIVLNIKHGFDSYSLVYSLAEKQVGKYSGSAIEVNAAEKNIFITDKKDNRTLVQRVDLETQQTVELYGSERGNYKDVQSSEHRIDTKNGIIQGLLWQKQKRSDRLVLMLHGGPKMHYKKEWNAELEIFLNYGADVFQLNFHGSSGYGRKFAGESRFASNDVRESISFIKKNLEYKNVYIYGESAACKPALEVIESNLLDISGLILVSYFPQVITWPAKLPPTLVFHSRNDYYCSLACVNEKLKKYDQSKNVEVIGIAGEGHIISMLESKARLFEKVVSFLSQKQ
jgi:hypothetical protein